MVLLCAMPSSDEYDFTPSAYASRSRDRRKKRAAAARAKAKAKAKEKRRLEGKEKGGRTEEAVASQGAQDKQTLHFVQDNVVFQWKPKIAKKFPQKAL